MTHPINYQVMPGLKYREISEMKSTKILKLVCGYYNISEAKIKSKSRERGIVFPRQVAMYMMRKYTSQSLKWIAELFKGDFKAGKDHTTCIHSIQTIRDLIATDETIAREVLEIEQQLM